jgi:hypothetical protein
MYAYTGRLHKNKRDYLRVGAEGDIMVQSTCKNEAKGEDEGMKRGRVECRRKTSDAQSRF